MLRRLLRWLFLPDPDHGGRDPHPRSEYEQRRLEARARLSGKRAPEAQ